MLLKYVGINACTSITKNYNSRRDYFQYLLVDAFPGEAVVVAVDAGAHVEVEIRARVVHVEGPFNWDDPVHLTVEGDTIFALKLKDF